MKRIVFRLIYFIFLLSILFPQNKLKFSAETVESMQKNDMTMNVFKKNVKVEDANRVLYADLATQIPDSNKVFLSGNVRMYQNSDSLRCDELIILKGQEEIYHAQGNVILQDSLRTVYGDNVFIEYNGDLIDQLNIISNARINNHQYLKIQNTDEEKFFQDEMKASKPIENYFLDLYYYLVWHLQILM